MRTITHKVTNMSFTLDLRDSVPLEIIGSSFSEPSMNPSYDNNDVLMSTVMNKRKQCFHPLVIRHKA